MPEILTVNVDYDYTPAWRKNAVHIAKIDKKWHKRSPCSKAWVLASLVHSYKKIIFTYDVKLVSLYYAFSFFPPFASCLLLTGGVPTLESRGNVVPTAGAPEG